jgi:hypothetical protein
MFLALSSPARARKSMMLPPPSNTARASNAPPSMVFMSANNRASGKRWRKIGTTFLTPSHFSSGVPISTSVTPAARAAVATASPWGTLSVSTEI